MPRMQGNYHYYSLYLLIYDLLDFLLICALSCFEITICAFGRFLESIPKQAFWLASFFYLICNLSTTYLKIFRIKLREVDQNIQTVSTGFLEFCINCFGPLLDSTLKNTYLHGFRKGRSIFFFYILIRQQRGEKKLKNYLLRSRNRRNYWNNSWKAASLKKFFFSFCVLRPFCCNFKNKTLQVDMGIEPTMVLWFRSKIQSESLQLSKVFIDTYIGMSIMYKSNIQLFTCE